MHAKREMVDQAVEVIQELDLEQEIHLQVLPLKELMVELIKLLVKLLVVEAVELLKQDKLDPLLKVLLKEEEVELDHQIVFQDQR